MFSKFSVKKPYTVVVGVALIIILGVVTFTHMTVDLLPDMNMPYALVVTTYPGASPEEVEEVVTRPVEQAMATVSNINSIQSTSSENSSTVILEFAQTANMDSVTIEMRESLDQIKSFWPDTVGNPMIMKLNPSMMPILITALSTDDGDAATSSKTIEEKVIPEIESVEGVASVTSYGNIEETVEVAINQEQVAAVNADMKAKLDAKFQEADAALADAKNKAESGKQALEAGQKQAAQQMGDAESKLSIKEEELKQAQLEINEKLAELNVSEAQLNQSMAALQASKKSLEAEIGAVKTIQKTMDQLEDIIEAGGGGSEEAKQQLDDLKQQLKNTYGTDDAGQVLKVLGESLSQLEETETQLQSGQDQLAEGKRQLEQIREQVDSGALTLAQARGQLTSAQIQTAAGLGAGSAQLIAGESVIAQQENQMTGARAEAYGKADLSQILTPDMVKAILTAENFSMPAGYVEEEGSDYLIRVGEKFRTIEDIKNMVLLQLDGMDPVRLSDVATVSLVDNSDETYAKINGKPGIMLSIQKQTGYSTKDVSDRVQEKVQTLEKDKELHLDAVNLMDQGIYIDMVVNSVLQNLLFGAVLAVLVLLFFLKSVRPTLVIACSIPISILTALVAMYFSGVTLNIISLSGLALGVGMLVDNSIVVIENIYRMRNEEGVSAKEAAIEGARQVSGAIAASTLTTICVFAPIVFTEGVTRQLFVDMGLTIAYSLLASLLVALTLVPMMSAGLLKKTEDKESGFFIKIKDLYGKMLAGALRLKPLVLFGALALLIVSGVLAISRGTEFMPKMESTEVAMSLEMQPGSTMEETAALTDKIMDKVGAISDIEDIGAMIGSTNMTGGRTKADGSEFYAITKENPKLSNEELQKKIERDTKELLEGTGAELTVNMSAMDTSALGSSGIVIQIKGRDLETLQKTAAEVKKIVEGTKGTQNVSDGTEENQQELRVVVDKDKAMAHGLTVAQVYQELSGELAEGQSATTLSAQEQDYEVYVVNEAAKERTREDVRGMTLHVQKEDGTTEDVKLSDIAEFEDASGLQAISRKDQSRYMSVTAEIKDGYNIGLVSNDIKKELRSYKAPAGCQVEMAGEDETINEAMIEVLKMLGLAVVFMYLIMVAQFQSLRSPFIVMFTVPLAFTGGLLGLWASGSAVSVIAMIGFVMLSGIIVNNGIVFVDYTNQLIRGGVPQREALIQAGKTRLRPIIMTALTTILGLSTMALGMGMGSDMVQPMAVVVIGGLLYGTLLTLFVVPCIFDLFHKREKARLSESMTEE